MIAIIPRTLRSVGRSPSTKTAKTMARNGDIARRLAERDAPTLSTAANKISLDTEGTRMPRAKKSRILLSKKADRGAVKATQSVNRAKLTTVAINVPVKTWQYKSPRRAKTNVEEKIIVHPTARRTGVKCKGV